MTTYRHPRARDARVYPYTVACYYGRGLKLHGARDDRKVGDLAIETQNQTESGARMDFDAARARPDIGKASLTGPDASEAYAEDEDR